MNRIEYSLKAYENMRQASHLLKTQAGKGNNSGSDQKKSDHGKSEFREILIKKIKSA